TNKEAGQCSRQKIPGNLFRTVDVILHILDEVAPRADLRANVHELRNDSSEEVWVTQQIAETALRGNAGDAFNRDSWEARSPDEQCKENRNGADDEIRNNYPHGFSLQIVRVCVRRLHGGNLSRSE